MLPRLAPLVVLLAAAAARAGVIVVQAGGPYATLQQAVDAAQEGDTLLVQGTWAGGAEELVIEDKALALVEDSGASVEVGEITVRFLGYGKTVLLRGLLVSGNPALPNEGSLELFECDGSLRVENCTILGLGGSAGTWTPAFNPATDGVTGASVSNCVDAAFHDCTIAGGHGGTISDDDFQLGASDGGVGLAARNSVVALQGCTITGGHGGQAQDGGGDGGYGADAVSNKTGNLTIERCTITGGDGGSKDCDVSGCGSDGSPGTGLRSVFDNATATVRDSLLEGGALVGGGFLPGVVVEAGLVTAYTQPTNALSVASPAREQAVSLLGFEGEPGDLLFLWLSLTPGALDKPAHQGSFLLGLPLVLVHVPVGVIDPGGTASLSTTIPELGPGLDALTTYMQLVASRGGQVLLGPTATLTLLDGAF